MRISLRNCESSWVVSLLFSLILILRNLLKWQILLHSFLKIFNLEGDMFNHLLPHSIFTFQFFLFHVFILVNPLISLFVAPYANHCLPLLRLFHSFHCWGLFLIFQEVDLDPKHPNNWYHDTNCNKTLEEWSNNCL